MAKGLRVSTRIGRGVYLSGGSGLLSVIIFFSVIRFALMAVAAVIVFTVAFAIVCGRAGRVKK